MILGVENIGRNELCHCGSGLKYKKCCLDIDERKRNPKGLNQAGFLAAMRQLIFENGGSYKITFEDLQQVPPDEGIRTHYDPVDDSFTLSVVKLEKKPTIITPNKRIITG